MKRHAFDALSFSFGVIFLTAAVLLWGFDVTGSVIQWVGAGALLFLGASLLLTSRKRSDEDA